MAAVYWDLIRCQPMHLPCLSHVLLLLLSHFSHVQLCATPEMAAHQAPLSLGFSRQEHWSRLPFPSPMHESEKWKWSRSVVSDSIDPMVCSLPAPPSMGFSRQKYWSRVPLPSPFTCVTLFKFTTNQEANYPGCLFSQMRNSPMKLNSLPKVIKLKSWHTQD